MKTPMQDRSKVKDATLIVSITQNERQQIRDKASELGLTMSAYARLAIIKSLKESIV